MGCPYAKAANSMQRQQQQLARDLEAYQLLTSKLARSNLSKPFLDKPPRLIGAGSYNDIFVVRFDGQPMVLRLSYYSPYTLSKVQSLIRAKMPYQQLMDRARSVTAQDPVMVKNNYSRFANAIIEAGVCPHFVYMFQQKDVKCFAAQVKDQVKPERARHNLSFRYNNVSFHEKFQTSLRLKLRTLSELQVEVAVFQVLFALAVLQHYLPSFRHNDLSLDNILVTTYAPTPGKFVHYRLAGNDYWLPDAGILAAVTDFDLAHAPAAITVRGKTFGLQNQLIAKNQFGNHTDAQARNINASQNKSFDAYYFLYRLKEAIGSRPGEVGKWLRNHEVLAKQGTANKYISQAYPSMYPSVLLATAPALKQFTRCPDAAAAAKEGGQGAVVVTTYEPKPLPAVSITDSTTKLTEDTTTHHPPHHHKVTVQSIVVGRPPSPLQQPRGAGSQKQPQGPSHRRPANGAAPPRGQQPVST